MNTMRTKIVYILISDNSDFYFEQILVSTFSLRRYNPDVVVELVVDEDTNMTLVNNRAQIRNYVNSIVQVDVPKEYSKKQRSRFIKTNLRNLISGDFLFIDTDTIIRSSLNEIDNISYDVCATQEYNCLSHFTMNDKYMYDLAARVGLGKELVGEPYFNSGVIYAKDSSMAHLLYETWHSSWKETMSKGLTTDQTPLCWANKKAGHVMSFLDDSWNCLIKLNGLENERDAKIIHYACEHKGTRHILSLECFFATLKHNGVAIPIIDYFIESPSLFILSDKEEIFFRKVKNINFLYSYSKSLFSFILWQAELYKSTYDLMIRCKIGFICQKVRLLFSKLGTKHHSNE